MHRLNREISRQTGIHWLTVHRIIYRDLQVNCVKRRRAPQLFETNRVARLTCCKQLLKEVQFNFIWFRDEKCLPSNHHSTPRTIRFMHQLITRSDISIPADCYACRLWRPFSVAMSQQYSQVGMTEVIFVNPGVKVNGQHYCDVLLSQQMLPAIKRVAKRCLFIKQYVAYGETGHFLCSVISQGKVVALDRWGGKWNHFRWRIDLLLTMPKIIVIGHLLLKLL